MLWIRGGEVLAVNTGIRATARLMTKAGVLAAGLAAILAAGGCQKLVMDDTPSNPPRVLEPAVRTFRVREARESGISAWYDVEALRLASGTHSLVYADKTLKIPVATGKALVAEYDRHIYDTITSAFGEAEDVDGNGKVIILLLDIIDGYAGTGGYVAGYFDERNMFSKSVYADSNEADMLFLDVKQQNVPSREFYTALVHELQHLIYFSRTARGEKEQDTWLSEGLATAAEYVYGGPQQRYVDYFNSTDDRNTIPQGDTFYVWGNRDDPRADYATVYLFFQWLRIHAKNGRGVYRDILASRYRDYRAVVEAANAQIKLPPGADSGWNWETLFRAWMLANAIGEESGVYGYRGEISPVAQAARSRVSSLFPGEGVFSLLSGGSFLPPGSSGANIRYVGFASGTFEGVSTASPYSGDWLLTFNANADAGGSPETCFTADIPGGSAARLGRPAPYELPLPESYPVDALFGTDGARKR
ncbi:hypothetical protein [Treponema endosymbiont of Eucomonympha sp.]|uniref:hypothetical protein n=1 Tax=Treponema endosymbiont of Eucomonympha sp. TaxID=1580831 RepID=UPI000AE45DE2|nr:hypothetical protein [Treponema endosymbiont of Eucomonympha sp.]